MSLVRMLDVIQDLPSALCGTRLILGGVTSQYVRKIGADNVDLDQSNLSWLIRVLSTLLYVPLCRIIDGLRYAIKCHKAERQNDRVQQEKYYRLMLKEDEDIALLGIFDILECACQLVIQISSLLLGIVKTSEWRTYLSAIFSFSAMSLAVILYHRGIRFNQEDKSNLTYFGMATIGLWQLMMAISRIAALSALSSVYWQGTIIIAGIHWALMFFCFNWKYLTLCSDKFMRPRWYHRLGDIVFDALLSLIYIFVYITPREGPTRNRYIFYYVVFAVENIAAYFIWRQFCPPTSFPWLLAISFAVFGGLVLGFSFMGFYYLCVPKEKPLPNPDACDNPRELPNLAA